MVHGDVRQDDYHWMREKDDPEVIAYLTAENAYTDAVMKPTVAFQESLYAEMLARIKEDDQSVPYRLRGYYYYSRTEKGKQYPIYCRKAGSLEAPEQVMLDLNQLAEGHPFLALGASAVSDDGRRLAYTTDVTGFREYTLHVKDLRDGRAAARPRGEGERGGLGRGQRDALLRHRGRGQAPVPAATGTASGVAVADLLHEEPDALFRFHVGRSRSLAYLFLVSGSFTSTEVRYLPAGDPGGAWRMVLPREPDHEYQVDHGVGPDGDVFYIRTNGGGRRNFRLVAAPVDDPHPARWRELIAASPGRDARGRGRLRPALRRPRARGRADPAARHRRAHRRVPSRAVPGADLRPELGGQRGVRRPATYRVRYQSLVTPASVFDYEIAGRAPAPAQADGGAGRLRPHAVRVRAPPRDGQRRHPRAHLARAPRRIAARRLEPDAARGLRGLRLSLPGRLLVEPAEPARPRGQRGDRPHPGRRRAGQALARRRPHDEQAQHVHRLHRGRRLPGQEWLHRSRPAGHRGRQRGRPAHGRGAQPAPRSAAPPRCCGCPSWT